MVPTEASDLDPIQFNEIVGCIHRFLENKYGTNRSKRLGTHPVEETSASTTVEIRVDTTVAREVILIEVRTTSQYQQQFVENKKRREPC